MSVWADFSAHTQTHTLTTYHPGAVINMNLDTSLEVIYTTTVSVCAQTDTLLTKTTSVSFFFFFF